MATIEEDWTRYSDPNAEWEAAVKAMGGFDLDLGNFKTIPEMRSWMKSASPGQVGQSNPSVREEDHKVAMRDGHDIVCRVYTPVKKRAEGHALAFLIHGGGFCIGGLDGEEALCRRLSDELGVVAVNVDYRLSPEHPFPTPVNDTWDALQWTVRNATTIFGADPLLGFIVGGTSAGGNLATVIGHLARDTKLSPPLTGLLLMIPAVLSHSEVPEKYAPLYQSWTQNAKAPILGKVAVDLFMSAFAPDQKSELFNAFNWPGGHGGLPPTVFLVCGKDPLRDEALLLEKVMREDEGIKTKLHVYGGLPHGFWMVMPQMDASKEAANDSFEGVKWLLEQGGK